MPYCYRSRTTTLSPAVTCALAVLRFLIETELYKDATNALTNWRKITAEMKLNKDAISENKHGNKNVHDAKSSRRSLQNLVNVYECLGMELQVGKYLEDVSHLLYECTCKKTPNLCVCFCWCCRHLGCTFETEPAAVTAQASVHGLRLTDLCCCLLVGTLLRGPQEHTFKQNTLLPSELEC